MRFPSTLGWGPLVVVVGGPTPLLAAGPGCGSPPLLAGVRCRWWLVIPRHSWRRIPVAVPDHSWLSSAGCGGGGCRFRWGRVAVSRVVCVRGAGGCAWCSCFRMFCVFVVPRLVVVWPLWCGCVFVARWSGCVCVCVVCRCLSPPLSAGVSGWCLCGCGWCALWVDPRHSWLRVLGAVPRHSWLVSSTKACKLE